MSDITLNDDQRMLVDSARRYIERGYTAAQRAQAMAREDGCLPQHWSAFAEMGWLAMAVPESQDGLSASTLDLCLLAEEQGRGLINEPWLASGVLATDLMARAAAPAVQDAWLPALAQGARRIAFVPRQAALVLRADANAPRLDGRSGLVVGAAGADAWLVEAHRPDGGTALLLAQADPSAIRVEAVTCYDGRSAARLHFVDAPVQLLAEGDAALLAVQAAERRAGVVHAAELVGSIQRAFDITLDYAKTRRQFGRSIGDNQVVQHRLVDLLVEVEETRALVRAAARTLDDDSAAPSLAARRAAAAVAQAAGAARHAWKECVQLHGAIGMTQEYELGQYVRRLAAAATLFGGEGKHLDTLAALALDDASLAREAAATLA
ncbi:acyl-CoA dehydrogenase family protein [Variovorax sp.]|uniref:acyl-CoA dehydrogenase family protein n=1 Tax=Variovorax sp. TaxID=1871043 RepID=UPI002D225E0B|nr:acyl-CoA dehydrogenase family protein [Variovorax sp.]HYP83785.1 acyl-CoA dehydrogenase family protein [Variovorax sp.]